MLWVTIAVVILTQAVALPLTLIDDTDLGVVWASSILLWVAYAISVLGTVQYMRMFFENRKSRTIRRMAWGFIDTFLALQFGLAALGTSIFLFDRNSTFSVIVLSPNIYAAFWEHIFPTAVGTFNGVGFARAFPLKIVAALWPILCTWTGVAFRVLLSGILIYFLSRSLQSKQINRL